MLSASGFTAAAVTGSVLYYRSGATGGFTVAADAEPGVSRVDFAPLGTGWSGGGSDPEAPYSASLASPRFPSRPRSGSR